MQLVVLYLLFLSAKDFPRVEIIYYNTYFSDFFSLFRTD